VASGSFGGTLSGCEIPAYGLGERVVGSEYSFTAIERALEERDRISSCPVAW
jgi:hypothetical protein